MFDALRADGSQSKNFDRILVQLTLADDLEGRIYRTQLSLDWDLTRRDEPTLIRTVWEAWLTAALMVPAQRICSWATDPMYRPTSQPAP